MGSFDYYVKTKIKMQMIGMLDLVADTPNGVSRIIADGSLVLQQKDPVLIDSQVRKIYNSDPLSQKTFNKNSIGQIRQDYHDRKEKLDFDHTQFIQPMGSSYTTTIEVTIHVPLSQEIKYRPGVMETLKFAWVQYIMVLIPSLLITWKFMSFLFESKILEALRVSDLKPKRKII